MDAEWERLLRIAREISTDYPASVFIGGVAVAIYARSLLPEMVEASHDADFYLSRQDATMLRERYPMTNNRRLMKSSVTVEGQDLDVYVEHSHALAIPYDQLFAFSRVLDDVRVAALEHLLVLKIDAALGRIGSDKGQKDLRDLAVIALALDAPRKDLLAPFLTDDRLSVLNRAARSGGLFPTLNAHQASKYQSTMVSHLTRIADLKAHDFRL